MLHRSRQAGTTRLSKAALAPAPPSPPAVLPGSGPHSEDTATHAGALVRGDEVWSG
jgi:hypothetical protein